MNIFNIGNIPEDYYSSIGGKAKGLDILSRNGFNVPKGFVITNIDKVDEEEIYKAFDALKLKTVSVRSSASNEDASEASNAGQYETILFVNRDNLIDSIKRCLESLDSQRAKAYAEHFDINDNDNQMNIVVQQMINSKAAGVFFTSDPMNGQNVLIEAVKGQGENLVSGKKEANRYSISKASFNGKGDALLNEETLQKLYEIAKKIEETFDEEMDCEWAMNGDLYLLQMRPITTEIINIHEFDRTDDLNGRLFTKRNVGEMMPGAVTPLTLSTSTYAIDYGMRYMLVYAGAYKKLEDIPPLRLISSFGNHLFFDMSLLYEMNNFVSVADPQNMNLSIMGEYYDYPPVKGKKRNGLLRVLNSAKFLTFVFSGNKAKKKIDKLITQIKFDDNYKNAEDIYIDITKKLESLNQCLIYHYQASSYSGSSISTLYLMLDKYFPDKGVYQAFMAKILSNIPNIESADIIYRLQQISNKIKEIDPNMASASNDELLKFIKNNADVLSLYNEFLAKHGHRSVKEAEMRSKPWKRDEESLMAYLKTILNSPVDLVQGDETIDLKQEFKFVKGLLNPFVVSYAKKAREAVVDREYTKSRMIKVIDLFKDRYVLLADKMVEEGLMPDSDLIYFFTNDEIANLFNPTLNKKWIKKGLSRRKTLAFQEELFFDDVYVGRPNKSEDDADDNSKTLKGVPVCVGKVTGKVRIVNSIEDANKLEKGDIMVAKFTDIGWSPYYSKISGLVTEIGSSLSHGAVVAREYGLPTVVNVKKATRKLQNGQKIELDASSGTIKVLE